MKKLKEILALTMVMAFVITSCNKEELFQNSSTIQEELSSKTTGNAFMDLVNDDVYPTNLLSTKTIKAFSERMVMLGDEIASADGSVLEADLNEDQIKLFFDLLAEQDYQRANTDMNESIEARFGCKYSYYVPNKKFKQTVGYCINTQGSWCKVCYNPFPYDDTP